MLIYISRRFIALFLTLVVASGVIFTVLEILPGDPAEVILGTQARPDTLAALRAKLGLNEPAPVRYAEWVGGMVHGDLGTSYTYSVPVSDLVKQRIWVSIPLAILALILSTLIAIPVGVVAATNRNKPLDFGIMGLSQFGIALPNFWFGLLLVYIFAIGLRWLPSGGFPGWSAGVWPAFRALILPAVALALPQAAILARVTRSALLDVLGEDYIRTARAKGLTQRATVWRHGVRNALIPVLTILGLQFSFLIAGTVIIENVFYLPGLGRLVFQAIAQRDLMVVKSVVLLIVAAVVIVTFLVDIAYAFADPRLKVRR
ncbi:MAG TPA: ABC transporter permease [Rhizobiaceae bacterium]|nr:ABC transporter permease [Rhizobiaceae bacterium]